MQINTGRCEMKSSQIYYYIDDFSTWPITYRESHRKTLQAYSNITNQFNLIGIYRVVHPSTAKYIFLSSW